MACPEYFPEKDAPREVTQRLSRFGGLNPFNLPNWRLCLADHRHDMRAGIFHRMPGGKLEVCKVDANGRMSYNPPTGVKVEYGTFPVKKYPVNGWILERWYPNHVWGSREWWNSQKAADGLTPILGEYPSQGDYWMQAGPWEKLPELEDIETAISMFEREMSNRPVDIELYIKTELAHRADEERDKFLKYEADLAQFVRSEIDPIWKSTTLEASRIRNAAARAAGQTSHVTL